MPTWSMISFQDSASSSMEQLIFFHDFSMSILTLITVLISTAIIITYCSKNYDRFLVQDQKIEIIWSSIPVLILIIMAVPSLQTLYILEDPFPPSMTLKATGHQWYWSYEYADFPGVEFDSYMLPSSNTTKLNRLLDSDNSIVLPVNTKVRMIVTAADVIHAWTVPSLGVKVDAVPGRLNQLMFTLKRTGFFYGQCSEICGSNHSFMPIKIESVPSHIFIKWLVSQ
uniref:Cytochrome c oxidase subunit 2 n=1 Tax=Jesogammarus hinumensis TaxID=378308 RepID=A0A891ZK05_9CRUS|nr:cytochrome c oxidase subunit II [Jesogammarus hinumensis]QRN71578.1 cytochrome c oxidase subunit II [Jesogammarus hinumensis]